MQRWKINKLYKSVYYLFFKPEFSKKFNNVVYYV